MSVSLQYLTVNSFHTEKSWPCGSEWPTFLPQRKTLTIHLPPFHFLFLLWQMLIFNAVEHLFRHMNKTAQNTVQFLGIKFTEAGKYWVAICMNPKVYKPHFDPGLALTKILLSLSLATAKGWRLSRDWLTQFTLLFTNLRNIFSRNAAP